MGLINWTKSQIIETSGKYIKINVLIKNRRINVHIIMVPTVTVSKKSRCNLVHLLKYYFQQLT